MSLTLIVVINVAIDAALLSGLAWALSRPAKLTPHLSTRTQAPAPVARHSSSRSATRVASDERRVDPSRVAA